MGEWEGAEKAMWVSVCVSRSSGPYRMLFYAQRACGTHRKMEREHAGVGPFVAPAAEALL